MCVGGEGGGGGGGGGDTGPTSHEIATPPLKMIIKVGLRPTISVIHITGADAGFWRGEEGGFYMNY